MAATPATAGAQIAPTFADVGPREDAEATYVANAYDIIHVGKSRNINEEGSWWRPSRGLVYRISVEHDAFFLSLGRPDLAQAFASRHSLGVALNGMGLIVAWGGVILTPWMLATGHWIVALGGVGMMLGGIIAREIGEDMQKPTLPENQAVAMTQQYNAALRAYLRLGPLPPSALGHRGAARSGTVAFAPFLGAGTLGAGVGGTF